MVYGDIRIDTGYLAQDPLGGNVLNDPNNTASENLLQGQNWVKGGQTIAAASAGVAAIGAFFSEQLKRQQAKADAQKLEFQAYEYEQAASAATEDAHLLIEAGKDEVSRMSAKVTGAKRQQVAQAGRRGVIAAAGSSAEVRASMEIMRQIDAKTINLNTERQANKRRMEAVNLRNRALMARTSAANLRDTGKGITPYMVALGAGFQQGLATSTSFMRVS